MKTFLSVYPAQRDAWAYIFLTYLAVRSGQVLRKRSFPYIQPSALLGLTPSNQEPITNNHSSNNPIFPEILWNLVFNLLPFFMGVACEDPKTGDVSYIR